MAWSRQPSLLSTVVPAQRRVGVTNTCVHAGHPSVDRSRLNGDQCPVAGAKRIAERPGVTAWPMGARHIHSFELLQPGPCVAGAGRTCDPGTTLGTRMRGGHADAAISRSTQ